MTQVPASQVLKGLNNIMHLVHRQVMVMVMMMKKMCDSSEYN